MSIFKGSLHFLFFSITVLYLRTGGTGSGADGALDAPVSASLAGVTALCFEQDT